jgi:hypothetical protein
MMAEDSTIYLLSGLEDTDLFPILESEGIFHAVIALLYPAMATFIYMLTCIMMDVMQLIHEIHHVIIIDCSLSGETLNNRSRGRCSSPQTPYCQAS